MIYASIDLGTNTCNLSISDWNKRGIEVIYSDKKPIKLGAEGFPDGKITIAGQERVIKAINAYKKVIKSYDPVKEIVVATSAVRNATNREEVAANINASTGYQLNIISGDDEAELIFRGVREAVPLNENPYLLLDIGGGSNEIQVVNKEKVFWRKSIDLGIARLLNTFKPSDPLKESEIEQINLFLYDKLSFLKDINEEYDIKTLIGSSGSFDTFASMYIHRADLLETYSGTKWFEIPLEVYNDIHKDLINNSMDKRLDMPGMEKMRVEMIPLASVFTKFLINLFGINQLIRSSYALKEGVIISMARNLMM